MVDTAHVASEEISESINTGIKAVVTKHLTYTVYENIRKEANSFGAYYFCSVCDRKHKKFNSKLIRLPGSNYLVCRSCINTMDNVLKEAQLYDCRKGRGE